MQAQMSLPRVFSPSHERTTTSLLMALLALRLLLGLILMPFNTLVLLRQYYSIAYTLLTCLLTAWLIWHERARLATFHISKLAVIFFVTVIPLQILLVLSGLVEYTNYMMWLLLPITAGLAVRLLMVKDVNAINPPRQWLNLLIAIVVGAALGLFAAWIFHMQGNQPASGSAWQTLLLIFLLQMSNAASQEEPLYRGFLWGWLALRGWKGARIWLVQAFLFWLGHIYYLGFLPYSLWIVVPVGGLVLGLVAWRSRDIAPSMLAHTLMNTIGMVLGGA